MMITRNRLLIDTGMNWKMNNWNRIQWVFLQNWEIGINFDDNRPIMSNAWLYIMVRRHDLWVLVNGNGPIWMNIFMNPNKQKLGISELIAYDPVCLNLCINFKAMIHFICSSDDPIGEIIHFFWRLEYQCRDIQHVHCIWIKDASILGKSPKKLLFENTWRAKFQMKTFHQRCTKRL